MNLEQKQRNYDAILKTEALLAFAVKAHDTVEIIRLKARLEELVAEA